MNAIAISRKLSTKEAAAHLGIGESSLEKLRISGCGPSYIKLGDSRTSRVIYDLRDLESWTEACKRNSTAA
jgi:hypothetical protein